jgi:hypothetical protein
MSDRPWLEDADPSLRVERALLKRLNAQEPPSGSIDQGWTALASEIAGLQALGATTGASSTEVAQVATHGAKGVAGLGLAAKIATGVALAGGTLWTGSALLKTDAARSVAEPQRSHVPAPVERNADAPTGVPQHSPEPAPPLVKSEQSAAVARAASPATTLAEEGRLLAKAHQLVQAGQSQQALEILRSSESRYPGSVLYQEREVLIIEALGATGSSSAARVRAERFLKRYPKSPHAGRVERFVK